MIKINLLPTKKAKRVKKEAEIQYQLFGGVAVLMVSVLTCGYLWFSTNTKISALEKEKIDRETQLSDLKKKVKEVENYEKDKKVLEDKNRVIGQLQKNKQGPVLLLDEMAKNTPPRVWIVSLNEQGGVLDIDGKALTNIDIVEYINNLRSSKYFADLHLIESRQGSEGGLEVYQFKLKSRLIL
ncbi:MAG: PilN domain-containing protein [Nitrospirota bacterium]